MEKYLNNVTYCLNTFIKHYNGRKRKTNKVAD